MTAAGAAKRVKAEDTCMNKYGKTILKEFKTGFGRFIAIMAIIALGVGF